MNFVMWLKNRETPSRFETWLIKKADENKLATEEDFKKFFGAYSEKLADNARGDYSLVKTTLYYSWLASFARIFALYACEKAKKAVNIAHFLND